METSQSQGPVPVTDPAQSKEPPLPIKECQASETDSNINLVTWDGEDDPDNPKNWSFKMRWRMTAIASTFAFISPISTSMTAPALSTIAKDLHIHHAFEQTMSLSIFLLAYAFGPLFSAPMSEVYGRRVILQGFNLIYLAFNTACGFAQTGPQLIVCRFFAGFGGSAASVIASGILGDLWRKEERGLSVSIYTMVTLLGPTLGPLLGGFITQYSSWRWTFWSVSIADGLFQLIATFFFQETYAPVLLGRKAARLRKETGNTSLRTKWEEDDLSLRKKLRVACTRPYILLATQPIFQVLTLYISYLFGLVYLALATFAELWTTQYRQSISIAGLNYLGLAVGYIIGTQSCAMLIGIVYRRLVAGNNATAQPEFRLPLLLPGALMVPVGLLWYGWSAQHHLHWIMPDIGIALFAIGVKYGTQCTQLYALDVYPTYAASASAGAQSLRSLAGFTFPLFAPYLYDKLHYGWGNSVLALVGFVIGVPAPILLWIYGPALRRRSQYATGV
ncbi:MFS transporter [Aspergillus brunneoviolaceus CBS 621.78]|uniref:MFS multidrug transporter n=1 Tax=Aspergillus brunneoviolaceus CBS 621.78 TaxID=1450534 RepID=A0ACD1FT19_9EURO|nr:MFS multidrug transporter [Aspergillus brunneoviolaceus CBS 621.78]RAH40137.1 MFS multidrug transporter [Aspergillus brunneoviolaceus CBS 621.78]